MSEKKLIGRITHYFGSIGVAIIELTEGVKSGETISIEGATTNFQQKVESMQIDHKPVESAGKGQAIGMKVAEKVREGDQVFLEG